MPLDGAPIYVSLKTYLPGGAWYQRTGEYATAIAPTDENGTRVISPTPGSTLTQSSTTFRWIGDAESTSYHIRLGSSHRGHDLVAATLGAQATEYTVDLPIDGDPIYFSIATFLPGGAYYYRDYVYQTSNTPRATGVHFYINDHLGTPQQLVNIDQAITWEADYDAFGAATVTTELVSNNHRFPGQYFDAESGLHYNWHRYYDPETGRYTRSDPIGLGGGLNTFSYALENSNKFFDPNGESPRVAYGFGGYIGRRAVNPAINRLLGALTGTASLGAFVYNATHPNEFDDLFPIPPFPNNGPIGYPDTPFPISDDESGADGGAIPKSPAADRPWRNKPSRWKVVTRCAVNQQKGCDDCPSTIGGWAYGSTFREAEKRAQSDANANLGSQGFSRCQARHCDPIACFENGRQVACPRGRPRVR